MDAVDTYSNSILGGYSAGLVLIVIRIMYSMASMASEAQIKLSHNFTPDSGYDWH